MPWSAETLYPDLESEGVKFIVAKEGKTVHVFKRHREAYIVESMERAGEEVTDSFRKMSNLLLGRLQARCGKTFQWHINAHVGIFADDDLCGGCLRATTEDEQPLLFEHEVP